MWCCAERRKDTEVTWYEKILYSNLYQNLSSCIVTVILSLDYSPHAQELRQGVCICCPAVALTDLSVCVPWPVCVYGQVWLVVTNASRVGLGPHFENSRDLGAFPKERESIGKATNTAFLGDHWVLWNAPQTVTSIFEGKGTLCSGVLLEILLVHLICSRLSCRV